MVTGGRRKHQNEMRRKCLKTPISYKNSETSGGRVFRSRRCICIIRTVQLQLIHIIMFLVAQFVI